MTTKTLFSYIFVLLSYTVHASAPSQEFIKSIKENYPIADVENLQVQNKYGDINIITLNTNPDKLEIDVQIKVQAASAESAEQVFNRIQIAIEKHGSLVRAVTNIESKTSSWWQFWTNSSDDFKIIYNIRIPKAVEMELANKYGNIYCEPFKGGSKIDLKYGDIYTQNFDAPLDLQLKYGKGKIGACHNLDLDMGYGELKVESARDVVSTTKYSKLKINNVSDINIQSKYDNYTIGKADKVTTYASYTELDFESASSIVSNSTYSDLDVGLLKLNGDFNHKYGDIRIGNLGKLFENLEVSLAYCNLDLGVAQTNLKEVQATARYGDISFPDGYTRKDYLEEDHQQSLTLQFGQSGAVLRIRADYGNIRIKR